MTPHQTPRENDENARPNSIEGGPSDGDRLRFGFKKRDVMVPTPRQSQPHVVSLESCPVAGPGYAEAAPTVGDAADEGPRHRPPVDLQLDLVSKLDEVLGTQDLLLPLLRLKPVADRMNYKERIAEQHDHLRQYKDAMTDMRQRRVAFGEEIARVQEQANSQLLDVEEELMAARKVEDRIRSELASFKQQAQERGKDLRNLRETVGAEQRHREDLGKNAAAQSRRADRAEAELRAREATLKERDETILQRDEALQAMQATCRSQVDEAAELLQKQQREASLMQQEFMVAAQRHEERLAAEAAQAAAAAAEERIAAEAAQRAWEEKLAEAHASFEKEAAVAQLAWEEKLAEARAWFDKEAAVSEAAASVRTSVVEDELRGAQRRGDDLAEALEQALSKSRCFEEQASRTASQLEAAGRSHAEQVQGLEAQLEAASRRQAEEVGCLQAQLEDAAQGHAAQVSHVEAKLNAAAKSFADQAEQLATSQRHGDELAAEVTQSQARARDLEAQLSSARASHAEQAEKLGGARRRGDELAAELEFAKGRADELESQLASSRGNHADMAEQLGGARQRGDELAAKFELASTRARDLEAQLLSAQSARSEQAEQLGGARQRGEELAGELEQTDARARDLETRLSAAMQMHADTAEQLGVARQRERELAAKVEQAASRSRDLEAQLAEAAAQRDEQVRRSEEHRIAAAREATAAADAAAATTAEKEELRVALAKAKAAASEAAAVATAEQEELRLASRRAAAAAAQAAATAAADKEALQARIGELEKLLAATRSRAETRELELDEDLQAATARMSDVEARLEAAKLAKEEEVRAKLALLQEHEAEVAVLRRRLAEMEAVLKQKDADLRESVQAVKQLGRDHADQLQFERERAQGLETEVRTLRRCEEELRGGAQASAWEVARAQSDLAALQRRASELEASLRRAEAERDRLTEQFADSQAAVQARQEELAQVGARLTAVQGDLAATRALLTAKSEQADGLAQERHEVELEFRSYKEHHGTSNQQQMQAITELKLTVDKLSKQVESTQVELGAHKGSMAQQSSYIDSLEDRLRTAEDTRRQLHNVIQELKGNIRVFCRVRPAVSDAEISLAFPEPNKLLLSANGPEPYSFGFDKIFSVAAPQEEVFDEVSGLVQSALDGYKVCIFAYGQTGSGKTFTMQGLEEPASWGIIPRSLRQIFQSAQETRNRGWSWTLQASFLEVYNEALRDLLRPSSGGAPATSATPHIIKHDEVWGATVTNLTSVEVDSMEQITSLMARAARQRAVGSTDMNATSSRSHSIFALYIRGRNRELNSELNGALHLVDLAGSERLDRSGAVGDRLKETQNINRSLSSLADVFLAKAEGRGHVPFRNSKLTHLMEPCLSGQGKTLMLVNIAPERDNAHETLCSLRFAAQVSQCDTGGKPKRSARAMAPGSPGKAAPSLATGAGASASTQSGSPRLHAARQAVGGGSASAGYLSTSNVTRRGGR